MYVCVKAKLTLCFFFNLSLKTPLSFFGSKKIKRITVPKDSQVEVGARRALLVLDFWFQKKNSFFIFRYSGNHLFLVIWSAAKESSAASGIQFQLSNWIYFQQLPFDNRYKPSLIRRLWMGVAQSVTNIFKYSNILVTNIYSNICSYQFFFYEYIGTFVRV